jgi:hypothetical protein
MSDRRSITSVSKAGCENVDALDETHRLNPDNPALGTEKIHDSKDDTDSIVVLGFSPELINGQSDHSLELVKHLLLHLFNASLWKFSLLYQFLPEYC